MAEKFRSYEVARRTFSVIEMAGRAIIIVGIICGLGVWAAVAGIGLGAVGGFFAGLTAGLLMAFFGLMLMGSAQNGRASVDSAEYSQQSLAIAREALQISKQQMLKNSDPKSFAELVDETSKNAAPKASFSKAKAKKSTLPAKTNVSTEGMSTSHFMDIPIHTNGEIFVVDGREFPNRTSAQSYALELSKSAEKVK